MDIAAKSPTMLIYGGIWKTLEVSVKCYKQSLKDCYSCCLEDSHAECYVACRSSAHETLERAKDSTATGLEAISIWYFGK